MLHKHRVKVCCADVVITLDLVDNQPLTYATVQAIMTSQGKRGRLADAHRRPLHPTDVLPPDTIDLTLEEEEGLPAENVPGSLCYMYQEYGKPQLLRMGNDTAVARGFEWGESSNLLELVHEYQEVLQSAVRSHREDEEDEAEEEEEEEEEESEAVLLQRYFVVHTGDPVDRDCPLCEESLMDDTPKVRYLADPPPTRSNCPHVFHERCVHLFIRARCRKDMCPGCAMSGPQPANVV